MCQNQPQINFFTLKYAKIRRILHLVQNFDKKTLARGLKIVYYLKQLKNFDFFRRESYEFNLG